ncbi:MAG: serpin family protein [Atopostipes sp.]|nr:serpin family protein [Atopostipes sp.]
MDKKRGIFTIIALLSLTLFSGCSKEEEQKENTKELELENLLDQVDAKKLDESVKLRDSFLLANANFSFDLFKKLAREENAVFSPLPVYNSLALIANGAEDKAQNEIKKALNLEDLDSNEVNEYYHALMKEFRSEKNGLDLNMSNSIWYDQNFQANEYYLETNKTYYKADSFKLYFSDPAAVDQMNDWVVDQTNGKVNEMVDEIDSDTLMYLFSIIYFDADWKMPFKGSNSYEGEFHTESETLELTKMTGTFELKNIETADEKGVMFPYKGEKYSFFALLPDEKKDLRNYLAELEQEKIIELSQKIKREEIELHLPKFELSYEKVLNNPLKEMGVQEIFDLNSNSLGKMGEAKGNLFVNKILQKNYLSVDEGGTEAASAVSSEIATTSLPIESKVIDFNRPFLYGVINNETALPIFLGVMDKPYQ